jgi:hypothetical protein
MMWSLQRKPDCNQAARPVHGHTAAPLDDDKELPMVVRLALLGVCAAAATSAFAQELGPRDPWAFMLGKLFTLTCSDGTVGEGRLLADGSVVGKIRPHGQGEMRAGTLPPGTVRASNTGLCAYFQGLPFPALPDVRRIDRRRFHASMSIMGLSSCDVDSVAARSL